MQWYPLTFAPIFKEKIWGGNNLNVLKETNLSIPNLGESWEISGVSHDVSIVNNGPLKGTPLDQLLQNHGVAIVGKRIYERFGNQFPILIKYIDAAQDLSIQLHPDDLLAQEKHNSLGKTEMWYVMQTTGSARLILGFKEDCDKHAFAKAIQNNSVTDLLNICSVSPGESFFIPPGFVHAIGAGVTLAEIQQTSDVTYRVHDYDRRDDAGNTRELHVKDSIAAADYRRARDYELSYNKQATGRQSLKKTPHFNTDILQFEGRYTVDLASGESFTILMNVGANCNLHCDGKSYDFKQAQTYLIPAAIEMIECTVKGQGKLLMVTM